MNIKSKVNIKDLVFLFLMMVSVSITASAQAGTLSSGIIDSKRAIDWTGAGIPGGLPDANWSQCGTTIAAYSGNAAAINTAIANCSTNHYVLLGPGTFTLSSSIDFQNKSDLVLRGLGANTTFLVFTGGAGTVSSCNTGETQLIGICGTKEDLSSSPTVYNWTAGYNQGASSIVLSGTAGINTISSSNPTLLVLNQDDTGYSGNPAVGSAVDNGNYFACADEYETPASGHTGCSANGPGANLPSVFAHRWQEEIVTAAAVNTSTGVVTLSQPLKHPNWQSKLSPSAILWNPTVVSDGVENLSIDMGSNPSFGYAIAFYGAYQGWVSGVRIMNGYNWQIGADYSSHMQLQNDYLFNGAGGDSYGIRIMHSGDNLIVNNIFQQVRSPIVFDAPDTGSVIAYNFAINDTSSNASNDMYGAYWDHSAGDDFHLWEGNIGSGLTIDNIHGTHLDETAFRNFFTGWESCANGQCGTNTAKTWGTAAISYAGFNRYGNIIANVIGTPGFTGTYQTSSFSGNQAASFWLGYGNSATSPAIPTDPLTASSSLRWGNYDVASGAVRWCGNSSDTGWTSTCAVEDIPTAEVPVNDPTYPNAVPSAGDTGAGQSALPASFYYLSKPSWWGSLLWPAIGPDVSGGNVGYCSGTLNTPGKFAGLPSTNNAQCAGTSLVSGGWAGHVNMTPAMNCALNIMGMPLDGTGNVLPFNASSCYSSASSATAYGDVLGTGHVSVYDAQLTELYALGVKVPNFIVANALVDGHSKVDTYDAYLISKYALGLITKFPVENESR